MVYSFKSFESNIQGYTVVQLSGLLKSSNTDLHNGCYDGISPQGSFSPESGQDLWFFCFLDNSHSYWNGGA